ncbi:hypothetical protein P154DRAFT_579758 [Amniculicola lignicola CBS 123094]|uniref:F-box domain-containing protein n=1 Tax=Amniculicola lignicola CBS 123094 TaxID=1392246 RepID=A0A6A5W3U6_9PLEO|nr:hypothetical protein P154DRAFT_579758 [Amniculicola lignicola CBS 123094]
MGTLLHFPIEILTMILECLREEPVYSVGLRALINCLLVCKALHKVTKAVLFQHVYLEIRDIWNPARTPPLLEFLTQTPAKDLTQTLRVVISDPRRLECLGPVEQLLSTMKQVHTVSIGFEGFPEFYIGQPEAQNLALCALVDALPSTVVHLDIDTMKLELDIQSSTYHLCHSIGNLVPRLRTLRLRMECTCSRLWHRLHQKSDKEMNQTAQTTSELRVVTIYLNDHNEENFGGLLGGLPGVRLRRERQKMGHRFTQQLRELYEVGSFPHQKRLLVIRAYYVPHRRLPVYDPNCPFIYCYKLRDIGANLTLTFPCWRLVAMIPSSEWQYWLRNLKDKDIYAPEPDLFKIFEDPLSWQQLSNNSKLPPTPKSKKRHSIELHNNDGKRAPRPDHRPDYRIDTLWEHEQIVGAPLLHATEAEGLSEDSRIQTILPTGWEYYSEGNKWLVRRSLETATHSPN